MILSLRFLALILILTPCTAVAQSESLAGSIKAFEIIPPVWNSRTGDKSNGIRINLYKRDADTASLIVEGLADKVYELSVLYMDQIQSIDGAVIDNDILTLKIPSGAPDSFVRHTIHFVFKN